ncbi:fibrous sheath-interacting protein 1 [Pantherophis guttatus]|uniref:Fibrous sheath-interacting protein 1 n=1 Tax=Pantherophis guttatus TaxID=94885 RepID=A0A6P9BUZ9_PANGU|nr:fibrous sheath-interacting protein 1 [Pantherophis guttatus]XP_034273780.1 fibrous sheath-interacting protein 1 [Pantherophis guttatus]
MDITRGSLDGISRPASNSRNNHGSKILSSSLEILTPESDQSKVDFCNNHIGENSKENYDKNGEEYETQQMSFSEQISEEKTGDFQLVGQHTNQVAEHSSSSVDSEDDFAENKLSCSSASQNKPTEPQKVTSRSANLDDSKEKDVDLLILKAIKKMKRLDQILANKQSKERAVKKQGRELRAKLWEEFQSMTSRSSSIITEEEENTSRFLALNSPLSGTPDLSSCEDNGTFNIFKTQLPPENYETNGRQTKRGDSADSSRSSVKKMENTCPKSTANLKKTPNFVKKNIELAKDSSSEVMLDEEKQRLSELLKENDSNELQAEEETVEIFVPGEGYTPEPMEYHHLAEIDAKLKIIISDGDLSVFQSSCSKASSKIYEESLAYANRKLNIPGEKILRDTKEERDQQNRLKEINQQLKILEETPDVPPCLSEEQLNALLEGCMQSLRRGCDLNLTRCQENSVERMSPCDIFEENMPDSRNEVLDDIQLSENEEMLGEEYKDIFSKEKIDSCCNPSKTFFEFPMSEKKGNEEDQEEAPDTANGSEDFFMSKVLSIDKMKKPPFLDEPFYCVSMNNELSTDASIPSIPLKTRGDELKDEDVNEE